MNKQIIKRFWRGELSGEITPKIKIKKCHCGKLPEYHSSTGGFNFYGFYKCQKCNLFVAGSHQFPSIGVDRFGENINGEPKLFVVYEGENNPENGWNELITKTK